MVTLKHVDESNFHETKHQFEDSHYKLAQDINKLNGSVGIIMVSSQNKKDLVVMFDLNDSTNSDNRVAREITLDNKYLIVVKPADFLKTTLTKRI